MWSIHALQQDILLTWRRHFEKDSCTLLVHSATDSPSLAWRANTSRKHSAKWSCFSLSGNLSSSNVQILSSPSSAVSCSMVMCSTVSSANPSKSVNTQGPRCFLSKSFREAILAWHQSFHFLSSLPSRASPENAWIARRHHRISLPWRCFLCPSSPEHAGALFGAPLPV